MLFRHLQKLMDGIDFQWYSLLLVFLPSFERKRIIEFSISSSSSWVFHEISSPFSTLHKRSFDSSVGRAEDCRSAVDILRSPVRIRNFYFVKKKTDSSHAAYSKLLYNFYIDNYFHLFFLYYLQLVFFHSFQQKTIIQFSKSSQVHAFPMK